MRNLNIPDMLACEVHDGKVKFSIDDISTNWMKADDSFTIRVNKDNINPACPIKHLKKEIGIKNTLDEGVFFLKSGKYPKAIICFDEVLFYDPEYGDALLYKSHALRAQKHFVKALRYYKRSVNADESLKDIEYHKTLMKEANDERSNFPKLKVNIYNGDEHFAKGEFEKAVESYNRALVNPSKFKDKILSKLLNKKATAFVKMDDYQNALDSFKKSLEVEVNDYAVFGRGVCEFKLNQDINEKFKTRLNITKRQMLKQAIILNELGEYEKSLKITDHLSKNHYRADDFYKKLNKARKSALDELKLSR